MTFLPKFNFDKYMLKYGKLIIVDELNKILGDCKNLFTQKFYKKIEFWKICEKCTKRN